MVEEKARFNHNPTNFAVAKTLLMKEKDIAAQKGDDEASITFSIQTHVDAGWICSSGYIIRVLFLIFLLCYFLCLCSFPMFFLILLSFFQNFPLSFC